VIESFAVPLSCMNTISFSRSMSVQKCNNVSIRLAYSLVGIKNCATSQVHDATVNPSHSLDLLVFYPDPHTHIA
jgi:hypothetical protein